MATLDSAQLEGTVFGLLTIQLKPQLEKLLKLQDGSLTKEIQLTQDLLRLFIEYQVPSDLLSYEGDIEADVAARLSQVKGHVKSIMEMIEKTKKDQLEETAKEFVQGHLEDTELSSEECDMLGETDCAPTVNGRRRSRSRSPMSSMRKGAFGGQPKSAVRMRRAMPGFQSASYSNSAPREGMMMSQAVFGASAPSPHTPVAAAGKVNF